MILKGKAISGKHAQKLILKKAKWILNKLELVRAIASDDIVTGARVQYLGRKYYVEVVLNSTQTSINIEFTASKFKVHLPTAQTTQEEIRQVFELYSKQKAVEKIKPRLYRLSKETGLAFKASLGNSKNVGAAALPPIRLSLI